MVACGVVVVAAVGVVVVDDDVGVVVAVCLAGVVCVRLMPRLLWLCLLWCML